MNEKEELHVSWIGKEQEGSSYDHFQSADLEFVWKE
jgi:hypothetical protein